MHRSQAGNGFGNIHILMTTYATHFNKCAMYRAHLREGIASERKRRVAAAVVIQSAVRRYNSAKELRERRDLVQKQVKILHERMANVIKGRFRCYKAKMLLMEKRDRLQKQSLARAKREEAEDRASTLLARTWRTFKAKRERTEKRAGFDQALAETRTKRLATVCVGIQRWWRWVKLRRRYWVRRGEEERARAEVRREEEERSRAATCIQSHWRRVLGAREAVAYRARQEMEAERHRKNVCSAVEVVKFILRAAVHRRAWQARLAVVRADEMAREVNEARRVRAARVLQRKWRCVLESRKLCHAMACIVQRAYRQHRSRMVVRRLRILRREYMLRKQAVELSRERAALAIQCAARRMFARSARLSLEAAKGHRLLLAADTITRWGKVCLARRELARRRSARMAFLLRREALLEQRYYTAAVLFQVAWRRWVGRQKYRREVAELAHLRAIATVLAREEAHWDRTVRVVQAVGRGYLSRTSALRRWTVARSAACCIQRGWRCSRAARALSARREEVERMLRVVALQQDVEYEILCHRVCELSEVEEFEREVVASDESREWHRLCGDDGYSSSTSGCYD
eukprot:Sspe_Gene.86341::Locus_57025_Transcript_1_1_Confidence_1.000_Length_1857::g.86341::m.86341